MVGQIWNIMLNSGDNSTLKFQTRYALPAERANSNFFFIVTDNKLMRKSITHTTVLFSERRLARKAPWSRLSTSPTFCNSSVQVAIPRFPPHLPPLFVLQLKGALFLWWSKEKSLRGLPFYFLCMLWNFNFRFVESEACIWKYGGLLFFSAFKYYGCTTEVINIPELIKTIFTDRTDRISYSKCCWMSFQSTQSISITIRFISVYCFIHMTWIQWQCWLPHVQPQATEVHHLPYRI